MMLAVMGKCIRSAVSLGEQLSLQILQGPHFASSSDPIIALEDSERSDIQSEKAGE